MVNFITRVVGILLCTLHRVYERFLIKKVNQVDTGPSSILYLYSMGHINLISFNF